MAGRSSGVSIPQLLMKSAGGRSFARGSEYFQAGRVSRLDVREASASAVVRGSQPYDVTLTLHRGDLDFGCTCPYAADGFFCKHAVAVGLAWAEMAAKSAPPEPPDETLVELERRARAAGHHPLLQAPLERAFDRILLEARLRDDLLQRLHVFLPLPLSVFLRDADAQRELFDAVGAHAERALTRGLRALLQIVPVADPCSEFLGKPKVLKAWARERRISALLDQTLQAALAAGDVELLPGESYARRTPLRKVLCDPFLRLGSSDATEARRAQLRVAAKAWLEQAAALVNTGADEARQLLERPPAAPARPVLLELQRLALGRCAELRAAALLRPARLRRGRFDLSLQPLALTWLAHHLPSPLDGLEPGPPLTAGAARAVALPLEAWRNGLRPHCPRCASSACSHAFEALVQLVELLSGATEKPRHGAVPLLSSLAAELERPSWQRALASLEGHRATLAAPAAGLGDPPASLTWRVHLEGGQLRVEPWVKRASPDGRTVSLTRLSSWQYGGYAPFEPTDPRDLRASELVRAADIAQSAGQRRAAGMLRALALAALEGHPEVHCGAPPGRRCVAVRREPLRLTGRETSSGVQLAATAGAHLLSPAELELLLESSSCCGGTGVLLDAAQGRCLLVDVPEVARPLLAALQRFGGDFPAESHSALMGHLQGLERGVELRLPPLLRGEERPPDAAPLVTLAVAGDGALVLSLRVEPLRGGPRFVPGDGPREPSATGEKGQRVFCVRDLDAEARGASALGASLGLALEPANGFTSNVAPLERALDLVGALQAREGEGLRVEWERGVPRLSRAVSSKDVRLSVAERQDWFGLEGGAQLDGAEVSLSELLDAIRAGRRYVRVEGNRWAVLSRELSDRVSALAHVTYPSKAGLELSYAAAPLLEELAGELGGFEAATAWKSLSRRMAAARRVEAQPPAALGATLRDYQLEGFRWLVRLSTWGAGACLADDMGLGKTVQALALLLHRAKEGPALVVAPASVCFNWAEEAARFAPALKVIDYRGAGRKALLGGLRPGQLLVTSYALLARDAAALGKVQFGTVVLDEAQAVKNAHTDRAQAALGLKAGFRLALTGTPLENHVGELWSHFRFLLPGLLGSREQFKERFAAPVEGEEATRRSAALARVVRPFLLRRTKGEVERELPPRTDVQIRVELSAGERRRYEQVRRAVVAELSGSGAGLREEQRRFQVLAALTRLRQLACHVGLVDPQWSKGSSKLSRLLELVEELKDEQHRVLVFSQFTGHLGLAREALEKSGVRCLYLDGSTPTAARGELVRRFQGGEGDAFLISLKAGGTGLNLTGADNVVHLDPWWNPAVEDQASDRAHRIGQTRPVTVYRLISAGTIEQAILALHDSKRALIGAVLEGASAAGKLSSDELMALIRSSGEAGLAGEEELAS